jgi:hypothetical protein
MKLRSYILVLFYFLSQNNFGQGNTLTLSLEGQAIAWSNINFAENTAFQVGGRYIPEISVEFLHKNSWKIDGEFSANIYGAQTVIEGNWDGNNDIKPYRMWLRYSNNQFELRAGLQKINFGSATMFRPLMWFDLMDPRDPLQLTDGVYGLLSRYYFLNNTNIWFWILYGNEDPRGWDFFSSNNGIPEIGGRIQFPILTGELAASYHRRNLNKEQFASLPTNIVNSDFIQQKFALDGKWDIGTGIWFESVIKKNQERLLIDNQWNSQLSLGIDYTFNIGNGLTASLEHLFYTINKKEFFESGEQVQFSGINLNYPIGMIDNLSAIIFYSWEDQSAYRFLNWGRQYDKVSFYLMAYWNPEGASIYPNLEGQNLFGGKGFQLMFTYNH